MTDFDHGHAAFGLPEQHTEVPATDTEPVTLQAAVALAHPHSTEAPE